MNQNFIKCPSCRENISVFYEITKLAKQRKFEEAKKNNILPKDIDPNTCELIPDLDITIGDIMTDLGIKLEKMCCRTHITSAKYNS